MNFKQRVLAAYRVMRGQATVVSAGRAPRISRRVRVTEGDGYGSVTPFMFLAPPDEDLEFTNLEDFKELSLNDKLRLLAHISPEAARAYWDFVIFVGHTAKPQAYRLGSDEIDQAAQTAVDGFMKRLGDYHGSGLTVVHRMIAGGFVRGAFAAELVLDANGRFPLDLATPDPSVLKFRQIEDVDRGQVWELGQWQGGAWVSFADNPAIKYVPILPLVDSPYALAWIETAVFPALFLLMLLQDLRRVVANQGYPRLDLNLDIEKLKAAMPPGVANDPAKFREWVEATIDEVTTVYGSLEPDDAYVHTDVITVNDPIGAVGNGNLTQSVDELMQSLERMLVRAFKSIPFLMAARQTTTETQSNREWESYTVGIRIIQGKLGAVLNPLFTLALEAQGIQARVVFEFGEMSESEALRRAQTEQVEIANEWMKYQYGFITLDEAAEAITGQPAAGLPLVGFGAASGAASSQPSDAERLLREIRLARAAIEEETEPMAVLQTAAALNGNGYGTGTHAKTQ